MTDEEFQKAAKARFEAIGLERWKVETLLALYAAGKWRRARAVLTNRICGAVTRSKRPCIASPLLNGRCKSHGGKSTGARTAEGIARIREGQLRRWARWRAERDNAAGR